MMEPRERWDSRTAFVLASIGSAIGLGNIWRFPYICYRYGGGAFLIPYLVALFTAGIPILCLEFILGHKMRRGAPAALKTAHKGWEWLGWFALLVGFGIVTYYSVVMGWSFNYLVSSLRLDWGVDTRGYFFKEVLGLSTGPFELGSLRWPVVVGLAVSWAWIVGSIWRGPRTVGKVIYPTVILPWVLLITFAVRGLTLPGALEGLSYYLTPNFLALRNPQVWHAAYSQVFFSLTVGFGVMIAYASFLPERTDIVNNGFLIALADSGTAFLGGFAVFSTLGYYAQIVGKPVSEVMASGPELAFVTYPTIINYLPLGPVLGFLFFLMLLTLAVTSAFSLVEGVVVGISDKWRIPRAAINIGVAVVAFTCGLIYTTQGGLYWLDIVDHFMNNFGLFTVAGLQCIAAAWFYSARELRSYANQRSELKLGRWWELLIRYFVPLVCGLILVAAVWDRLRAPYGGYERSAEVLGGWVLLGGFLVVAVLLSRLRKGV